MKGLLIAGLAAFALCGCSSEGGVKQEESIGNELAKVNDPKAPTGKHSVGKIDPTAPKSH